MLDRFVESCAPIARATPDTAIRDALDRICRSEGFAGSERLVAFLRYLVDQSLAGQADRLKAYCVAVSVFGRNADFDPQTDPIVRIEASRLRRALERYYLTEGKDDPVIISVPKGAYVPTFALRTSDATLPAHEDAPPVVQPKQRPRRKVTPALPVLALGLGVLAAVLLLGLLVRGPSPAPAHPPGGPTLAVMPFEAASRDPDAQIVATGMTNELIDQMARFGELHVLGRETSRQAAKAESLAGYLRQFDVGYVVEGIVRRSQGRYEVTARLIDSQSGTVLWSQTYNDQEGAAQLVETQVEIASRVASALAPPYGAVFKADARKAALKRPDDWDAYRCTISFYDYRAALTPEQHAATRNCLERAVKDFPGFATAWAMLAMIYLDEDRGGFNRVARKTPVLELALRAAQQAARLEPDNVRALQALMTIQFFNQEVAKGMATGEAALRVNPRDSELLGEFGSRVAQSGQWERGARLLREAIDQNPGNAGYYRGHLALAELMMGHSQEAVVQIRQSDLQRYPLYNLLAAVILAEAGRADEARTAATRFASLRPDFIREIDTELAKRNFTREDGARFKAAMVRTGLLTPAAAGL